MIWCCTVRRAPIPQRSGGGLWTVLKIRGVEGNCGASIFQLYILLVVNMLGTRKQEEFRSDNQEQDDIDGTGEIENRDSEKRSCRRNMVVTE